MSDLARCMGVDTEVKQTMEGPQNLCSKAGFVSPMFHCPQLCQVLKDLLIVKGEERGTLVVLDSPDHVQSFSLG